MKSSEKAKNLQKNLLKKHLKSDDQIQAKETSNKTSIKPFKHFKDISDYTNEYNSTDYKQYATLYFLRLNQMKKHLIEASKKKWPNIRINNKLLETQAKEEQIIVGTIYKEIPLKPTVLKGMTGALGSNKIENFVSKEDFMIIEDESGRIRISNESPMEGFTPDIFVTGVVCALKGTLNERGLFFVNDIANFHEKIEEINESIGLAEMELNLDKNKRGDPLILLISGINVGNAMASSETFLSTRLLKKILGSIEGINGVRKIIVLGNTIYTPPEAENVVKGSYLTQEENERIYHLMEDNIVKADNFLYELSSLSEIDLMPGQGDLSNSFFPQKPIESFLYTKAGRKLNFVSNPYKCLIEDKSFILTSGQNINNIQKYTKISNEPEILAERTLEWGHICPSAPDSLRTYPFIDHDPLVIKELPNFYIIGNQKKYSTKLFQTSNFVSKIISVPCFSETNSFVLLNSFTNESIEIKIEFN